jgi:hypothetical protein
MLEMERGWLRMTKIRKVTEAVGWARGRCDLYVDLTSVEDSVVVQQMWLSLALITARQKNERKRVENRSRIR